MYLWSTSGNMSGGGGGERQMEDNQDCPPAEQGADSGSQDHDLSCQRQALKLLNHPGALQDQYFLNTPVPIFNKPKL